MNNGQNIDKFITDKEILASYYMKTSTFSNTLRCCEDHVIYKLLSNDFLVPTFAFVLKGNHDDNFLKSKTDLYDSKFDLGQLSLSDDSSEDSDDRCDYTNFKNATK